MPFGPQAHCEVDKRAVNQGTKYKREVGQGEEGGKLIKNGEQYDRTHIEHRRTNERRIVGTSAAKAHRLAPTKELPPSSRSRGFTEILKTKELQCACKL